MPKYTRTKFKFTTALRFALILAISILSLQISVIEVSASESEDQTLNYANVPASGQCGENLTWELQTDGTLTISGTGAMWDFISDDKNPDEHECPWEIYKDTISSVIFEGGITYVGKNAFSDCTNLTSVSFSDTIVEIGAFSFMGCTRLENFTLPNNLQSLRQQAFHGCSAVTSATIPDSVTFLENAFSHCSALSYVYIGGDSDATYYTNLSGGLFANCTSLEYIEVSDDNIALEDIDGVVYQKGENILVQYPCGRTDKEFTVPDGILGIASESFSYSSYLEQIYIPSSVTNIEHGAIRYCPKLKYLEIPSGIETLGHDLGIGCPSLEYIKNNSDIELQHYNVVTGTLFIDENGEECEYVNLGGPGYVSIKPHSTAYYHPQIKELSIADTLSLYVGKQEAIPVNITYWMEYLTGTIPTDTDNLIFQSSDTSIIEIDDSGIAIPKRNGTVTVTISPKYTASYDANFHLTDASPVSCTITVDEGIFVNSITLNQSNQILATGQQLQLSAVIAPENATNKDLTWSTSNEAVAIVDANGNVTAEAAGTAEITATAGDKSATCTITVENPFVTLKTTKVALKVGKTSNISIESGFPTNDTVESYRSSNTNVATVSANGTITAKANGTATITVTMKSGATANCTVTVTTDATKVTLNKKNVTIAKGNTCTLKATVTPKTTSNKKVTWTTSNKKIATVDKNGNVTAKKAGKVTITAKTANGKKASCIITVKNPSVTLAAKKATLKVGKTTNIKIKSTFPTNDKVKSYQSSNKKVASVNKNGKVTAKKAGKATITVTMKSGAKATFKVTVIKK